MENKLVFNDGTEILNGTASVSSNDQLLVRIPGNDLMGAMALLSDPNKTEEIICYHSIYKSTFKNYTNCYSVQYFASRNSVDAWLKGENTSNEKEVTVPKEYVPWEESANE